MTSPRRPFLLAAATLCAAAAFPAAAHAAWSAPQSIASEAAFFPDVAVNGRGGAVAVWFRAAGNDVTLRAAFRPAGGRFGRPRSVGTGTLGLPGNPPSLPQVAIDDAGRATAVWLRKDGAGRLRVVGAMAGAGGPFGRVRTLSAAGQHAFDPALAYAASAAVVAWTRFDGSVTRAQALRWPNGGAPRAAQTLSTSAQGAGNPAVAGAPGGEAAVVWSFGNGFTDVLQASRAARTGTFGAPQTLSAASGDAQEPAVAMGSGGETTAAWQEETGAAPGQVAASFAPAVGRFGTAAMFSPRRLEVTDLQIGADSRGLATVLWTQGPPVPFAPGNSVEVVRLQRGRQAARQTLQRSSSDFSRPAVAVAPSGSAAGVWLRVGTTGASPVYASVTPTSVRPFGRPQRLTAPGRSGAFPTVGVDDRGGAVAIWDRAVGSSGSAGLDVAVFTP